MKMLDHLLECGIPEEEARAHVGVMEQELGSGSTRLVSENIIEDTLTGHIRITRRVQAEYRALFARAGLNIQEYLGDRVTFLRAFRRANSLDLNQLIQAGPLPPFLQ